MWSEGMDDDAFGAFRGGNIFDPATQAAADDIYSIGGSRDRSKPRSPSAA